MENLIKKFIPQFLINWYHFLLAFLGASFYGFPSRKLMVIGITGTNGKSTTAEMISRILETAGKKTALLSSIRFKIGEKEFPNMLKMTMPGRFQIQKFLIQAVNSGCEYAILETTSEGIKQHRHRFIKFNAAVFTNLTPEHIEAHKGFENYKKAKGKLFQATKNIHVLNLDDKNTEYFLRFRAEEKFYYSLENNLKIENLKIFAPRTQEKNRKFIKAANIQTTFQGISFVVENIQFNLKLLGEFNVYNALAAICVGLSQGVGLETCKKALEKIEGIPGRMELVISQPFKVFVDYAFTPNALEQVYKTLIANYKLSNTKLVCVLGACGGGRDKWKRPVLGKIAAKYCYQIIITNEDPYDENPHQILLMIKSGVFNFQFSILNFHEIIDRREAIKKSLELAKENDIVVITGKGCEPWICVEHGKKIPWDDRTVVKEEIENLYQNQTISHK